MITREEAHKTLTARVGSVVYVDMESEMNQDYLKELRKLAEAATEGPWIAAGPAFGGVFPEYLDEVVVDNPESEVDEYTICKSIDKCSNDMEYIAEFNPVVAIKLLDYIDELLGK